MRSGLKEVREFTKTGLRSYWVSNSKPVKSAKEAIVRHGLGIMTGGLSFGFGVGVGGAVGAVGGARAGLFAGRNQPAPFNSMMIGMQHGEKLGSVAGGLAAFGIASRSTRVRNAAFGKYHGKSASAAMAAMSWASGAVGFVAGRYLAKRSIQAAGAFNAQ